MNVKKLILTNLPYVLFVYPFDKVSQAFRLAPGADLSAKILSIGEGFASAFSSLAPSFHLDAMTASIEQIEWPILMKITDRILAEVPMVNRVCYDLSPKPSATIEWE